MVPSAVTEVGAPPLAHSGKVDRRALFAVWANIVKGGKEVTDPRTPDEELLTEIWIELLNLPKIGLDEDFSELGGNFLLAAQALLPIEKRLGTGLTLRDFLNVPIVAELGQVVLKQLSEEVGTKDISRLLDQIEGLQHI